MLVISQRSLKLQELKTVYPGLASHPSHELFKSMMNEKYGFGGMMTIDVGSLDKANSLMELMQKNNLRLLSCKFRIL